MNDKNRMILIFDINLGLAVPVKVVTQPATAKKKELISSNWKSLMQTIAPPKR